GPPFLWMTLFSCPRSLSLGRSRAAFPSHSLEARARKRDAEPGPESGRAHYTPPGKIFHLENTSEGDFRDQHLFPARHAAVSCRIMFYYVVLYLPAAQNPSGNCANVRIA